MRYQRDNFHILTGGPGAGKTTLIETLRKRGFVCVDEVGRRIIQQQKLIGGDALHTGDPAKYLELMLSHSMLGYQEVMERSRPVFFDRGIPELSGYCALTGLPVPAHLRKAIALFRYAPTVFILPPWAEIYEQDAERLQDFDEAVATYAAVGTSCVEAGYRLIEVPRLATADRADFVLDQVFGSGTT